MVTATTEEIGVDDTAWMLDKLGEDVLPEQDKRELTENAVQAAMRAVEQRRASGETDARGLAIWDVDEPYWHANGVRKLCIIDNGDAFTEASFRNNILQLAPRGKTHGRLTNYGVGAKIAGVTRHTHGMVYQSWISPDDGIAAHLWRDPITGRYGLRRNLAGDGKYETIITIGGDDRPEMIVDTGTKVTLLGRHPDEDTFAPPADNPHRGKWLTRYLNTRYFTLPDRVTVQVREGDDYTPSRPRSARMRTITGQRPWLDQSSMERGIFVGSDFRVWWWILEPGYELRKDSHYITRGFVAAKFLHEMFDLREGRTAPTMLQKFGVTFGFGRAALIVEPGVTHPDADADVSPTDASVDMQRAHLKHNGAPLDWDRYAAEFRERMPHPIRRLVEDEAHGGSDDERRRRYRRQMEEIRDLFRLPRYKPTPHGETNADPEHTGPGGAGRRGDDTAHPGERVRPPGGHHPDGAAANIYPLRRKPSGPTATSISELPDVDFAWVSDVDPELPDRGGQMEDRAAHYVAETNSMLINADFRLFTLVIDHWMGTYGQRPAARKVITEAVRDVYTGVLVETVVGMLAFRGDRLWTDQRLADALSDEALTAAVMPRVAPHRQIGQILRGHFPGAA
jgi:hypothetical protein